MISKLPVTAVGTIGTRDSAASMNAPFLNGASRPSRERVPSGKMTTTPRLWRTFSPAARRLSIARPHESTSGSTRKG